MKRLAVLSVSVAVVLVVAISSGALARVAKASAEQVRQSLTCQCGCGLTIANCNHPNCSFAVPLRGRIIKMIAEGMSAPRIVASFRAEYGEKILSAPTMEGFNLLAWTTPFFMLLLGMGFLVLVVRRWKRSRGSGPAPEPPPYEPSDPALRRRLEEEVRGST